jgi:hypothetical protein
MDGCLIWDPNEWIPREKRGMTVLLETAANYCKSLPLVMGSFNEGLPARSVRSGFPEKIGTGCASQ